MKFRSLVGTAVLLGAITAVTPAFGQADTAPAAPANAAAAQPQQSGDVYQLPPDKLEKAIALGRIRTALDIGGSLWGLLVIWLLLETRAAAGLEAWAQKSATHRWVQGMLFFAVLLAILSVAGWPVDAIGHAASMHFGISVQGWPSWLGDQLKGLALTLVLGTLVMMLFHWVVRKAPRRYWLWLWLVTLPLVVLSIFSAPIVDKLFNKFEPLSLHHAGLVAKLGEVVKRTGTDIPPDRMFLMKASEKTNGLNAYVSGMGATKRIVVWDTTAGRVPDDVVMFVFGHESGHYVLHHIQKMLAIFLVLLLMMYWLCGRGGEGLMRQRGAKWHATALEQRTSFVVLLLALSIGGFLVQPVTNAISRHYEHEADVYGQEAVHGLIADPQATAAKGFNALGAAWLEDPNPGKLVEIWEYNHPTVRDRANFAVHYDPWKNGGQGKFFSK